MPKYLTVYEVFASLERENPEGVYPSPASPSAFFSTADHYALAATLATAYSNQERIYENYFPQTTDENIADWETSVFGMVSSLTDLQQRRDAIVAKLRQQSGISVEDILSAVSSVVPNVGPSGVEIIEWGAPDGSWMIGESQLGVSTFFSSENLVDAVGPFLCGAAPSSFGKTPAEWLEARLEAYTYEVRIYNYTLTPNETAALDSTLVAIEPARSGHVITDSLTDADRIVGST